MTFVCHSRNMQGSEKSLPLSPDSWPPGLHRSRPLFRCRRSWSWGWSRGWESPFQRFLALPETSWSCVCLDEVSALKPECHPENILFRFPHNFQSSFYSPKISSQTFGLTYLTLCNAINLGQQMSKFLWWKYPYLYVNIIKLFLQ